MRWLAIPTTSPLGGGTSSDGARTPRIGALIHQALGDVWSVVNVGAGAGSYEPADRYVLAVEPSAAMRARRVVTGAVPAIDAVAETLPLDDASIDAAMAIFTVHQWPDPARGLAELRRVTRGPVVVMTLDVEAPSDFWLAEYVPERRSVERARFPAVADIRAALGGSSTVTPVPIPLECTDGFIEAFYGRPEALLDADVREAQSGWQLLADDVVATGLRRLSDDLATGAWDARHGHLRSQPTYTGPLVLVTANP